MDRQAEPGDLALESRSLVVHSSPLRVGFTDDLLQKLLRRKNSWDVQRKRGEWLVVVGLEQAFPVGAKRRSKARNCRRQWLSSELWSAIWAAVTATVSWI
jgi:hypothetical protein